MKKVTVISPANIGLIKYWGFRDDNEYIPNNNNISMTMSNCLTTTTIELRDDLEEDDIQFNSTNRKTAPPDKNSIKGQRTYNFIQMIRNMSGKKQHVKILSENNFPSDAGIAASASSMSSITLGLLHVYELRDVLNDKTEISRLARQSGSASSARSIHDGFVELIAGANNQKSHAVQIADENHWDIIDIVAVVNDEHKSVSTSEGHTRALENPYYQTRLKEMQGRIDNVRTAIVEKNIQLLGESIEQEALSMHAVAMTSVPPAMYWKPGTVALMLDIQNWRQGGKIESYFTIDAGPNVHIIAEKSQQASLEQVLKEHEFVDYYIVNKPCKGAHVVEDHLF